MCQGPFCPHGTYILAGGMEDNKPVNKKVNIFVNNNK